METNQTTEIESKVGGGSSGFPGFERGLAGRSVEWIVDVLRDRIISYEIIAVLAYYAVLVRILGLGRSLWLDEAWEANAIIAPTVRGMFLESSWLPTCPPLFLILVRWTVAVFGLGNWVFRIVPAAMGLLAVLLFGILAARLFSKRYAIIATALFALAPLAASFSRTLKQYSAEVAATTAILLFLVIYLQRASRGNFWLLVGVIVLGLLFAYPVAFLLPGAVLVVFFSPNFEDASLPESNRGLGRSLHRAVLLASVTAGTLVFEYLFFLRPNAQASSLLRTLWGIHNGSKSVVQIIGMHFYLLLQYLPLPDRLLQKTTLVGAAVAGLVLIGFVIAYIRYREGERIWLAVQFFCLLPCLGLVSADALKIYPMVERTSLFLLPLVVVLLVSCGQVTLDFVLGKFPGEWPKKLWDVVLVGASLLVLWYGVRNNSLYWIHQPIEDLQGSVSYLQQNARASDIVWVHASTAEGFKFYARVLGWKDAPAKFGNVGWPCCPRGVANVGQLSTEKAVREDFGRGIPETFSGRVWLLYTDRPEHWVGVGLDEPRTMKAILHERGCVESPTPAFHNIGVSAFDCKRR